MQCIPCPQPREDLGVLCRRVCIAGPKWNDAAKVLGGGGYIEDIEDAHKFSGQNAVIAVMKIQDDDTLSNEDREVATILLWHISRVSKNTAEDDPYPDSSDSQLLLALNHDGDRMVLPSGLRVLSYTPGASVRDDVVVVQRDGTKELSLGYDPNTDPHLNPRSCPNPDHKLGSGNSMDSQRLKCRPQSRVGKRHRDKVRA